MRKLLINNVNNFQSIFSVEDVDHTFEWYGKRRDNASVEGIASITSNVATIFGDFVIRFGNNLKMIVTGWFKDVKRSVLKEYVDSHKLLMMQTMEANYSELVNIQGSFYPFAKSPKEMAVYFKITFAVLDMKKRFKSLTENYLHLAAAIRVGDIDLAVKLLNTISDLNMQQQLNIKSELSDMVMLASDVNYTEFGNVFNAVSEYKEAVNLTLSCSDELNEAVTISKHLDVLYGAFDKLKAAVSHITTLHIDFSQLNGTASTVNATGELIESYAVLTKEYHHLEHWLYTISKAANEVVKK